MAQKNKIRNILGVTESTFDPSSDSGRSISLIKGSKLGLLALALTLAGQTQAAKSVKLRYNFKPGEVLKYRLNMKSSATFKMPDGQIQKLNMTNYLELSQELIEKTSEGNFRIAVSIDKATQTVNGKNQRIPVPEGQVNILTIMPNGQVTDLTGSSPATSSQNLQMVFPTKSLRKGDTWLQEQTIQHPLPLVTKTEYEVEDLKATFPGYSGKTIFIRSTMGLENTKTPTKEVVKSSTKGSLWFDARKGRIVRSSAKSTFAFELPVTIPDLVPAGSAVKVSLDLKVDIALIGVEKSGK
jgi:hypothetical protein